MPTFVGYRGYLRGKRWTLRNNGLVQQADEIDRIYPLLTRDIFIAAHRRFTDHPHIELFDHIKAVLTETEMNGTNNNNANSTLSIQNNTQINSTHLTPSSTPELGDSVAGVQPQLNILCGTQFNMPNDRIIDSNIHNRLLRT